MQIALAFDRLQEIEQMATTVRQNAENSFPNCFNLWNDMEIFTAVAAILSTAVVASKANLCDDDGLRVAGLLKRKQHELFLYFEAHEPAIRQRFSIAHELGHHFLHLQSDLSDVDIEIEADAFAAAFLMPSDELRADMARFGPAASFLAQRYSVSDDAMRQRLKTLSALTPIQ